MLKTKNDNIPPPSIVYVEVSIHDSRTELKALHEYSTNFIPRTAIPYRAQSVHFVLVNKSADKSKPTRLGMEFTEYSADFLFAGWGHLDLLN